MRFFKPRSGKKTITHTHKSVAKAGKAHAPGIEFLEARINPTDVIASTLLFRGDLIADGNLWKSTGSPIEVGFNPTQGEAFRSLVTLKGDTILDPAASKLDFQGVGAFASPSGLVDFWSSTTLSTFDIQKLVSVGGETIVPTSFVVSGLNFKPGNLRFDNPNGGSTNDSILATQGRLELPLLSGFGVDVVDSNSVKMDPAQGIDLTGISTKLSGGSFKAGGANFDTTGLTIGYAPQEKTFSVYGSSNVTFKSNTITASFGDSSAPGLSIVNGDISTFQASLSGSFSLSGGSVAAGKLAMTYNTSNDTLGLSGSASFSAGSTNGTLGLSGAGIRIRNGAIDGFQTSFSGKTSLAGVSLSLANLSTTYSAYDSSLKITGKAGFSFGENNASIDLIGQGLLLKAGAVQSVDATLDGSFALAGASLGFAGISVYYSKLDSEFSLSNGKASFSFGDNNASVSLGAKGLVIKNGSVDSVDATISGALKVAGASLEANQLAFRYNRQAEEFSMGGAVSLDFDGFNLDASLAAENGLVIRSGAVESIDATVSGSVTIGGASVSLTDSAITYSRADDRLTAKGTLGVAYESNSFTVGLRNDGLVIQGGAIVSLDGIANGKISIANCQAVVDNLSVVYSSQSQKLQLTGGASVTVGESSVAFDFLADKGGLVIENGTVSSLAATAKGAVVFSGNSASIDAAVTYNSVESFLECSGAISVSLANGNSLSAGGLIRIQNGAIQKIDAKVSAELDVAGIKIEAKNLSFTYETSGTLTGLRISTPETSTDDPALKVVIPSKNQSEADTEILIPTLGIEAGIQIKDGALESFRLECSGAFSLKGLNLKNVEATIVYSAVENTVITLEGNAEVDLDNFGISVTLGKKDSNGKFISPGIKIVNSVIDTVDIKVSGEIRTGNGFTLASADAGITYVANGSYKNVQGATETGPVWGIYGKLMPLGWNFTPTLAFGTKETPGILIHAGNLLNSGELDLDFAARYGSFLISGIVSMTPVAADTYIESNNQPSWQEGETVLVDQNGNGTFDESHFVISARARISIPFIGQVFASITFTSGGKLSGISISVPTRLPIPGTPLILTALAGTVENLDNPSNLTIRGQVGMSLFGTDIFTSGLQKLNNYYESYLDLQVLGRTDAGIQLPELPSLPTIASAHFTGEITYSPGKLVIEAKAWLFAASTRYTGTDTFKQADGEWSGLVEATGKVYLDWANSRYYASLDASALGGIFRANALLGMDFANDIYVVQSGATLDVEGTALDFAPVNYFTPLGSQFIVIISSEEKFVGGWFETPFGPGGVGYDFIDDEVEFIGDTKVKQLKKIAESITIPPGSTDVPVADRKFNTNFDFNYSIADIENAGGLPLNECNSITLTSSFLAIDWMVYERTNYIDPASNTVKSTYRQFPNFIAPGNQPGASQVRVQFDKNNSFNNSETLKNYTILPARYSEDAQEKKDRRKGTISVTIYPFVLTPTIDFDPTTGDLTTAGREKVALNAYKTFDKNLFSGGNFASITLASNTPALIVNDQMVADAVLTPLPSTPPENSDTPKVLNPTWLSINDKNYSINLQYEITYPQTTQVLDPNTGLTSTQSSQITSALSPTMSVIKNVTPPVISITPGPNANIANWQIDDHTNATYFTAKTSKPTSSVAQQTKFSLSFASQVDAAQYRWQAVVAADEILVAGNWEAEAVLFQQDAISNSELLAGQISQASGIQLLFDYSKGLVDAQSKSNSEILSELQSSLNKIAEIGPDQPILFIGSDNGANVVKNGVMKSWRLLQTGNRFDIEATIKPDGSDQTIVLTMDKFKPARLGKANVILRRSNDQPSLNTGDAYTAAVIDPKSFGSNTTLSVFRPVSPIVNGVLPPLPTGQLDISNFVINPLPAGVQRQVNIHLENATRNEIVNEKWLFKTLNNQMRPVTVTGYTLQASGVSLGDMTLYPSNPSGSENLPLLWQSGNFFFSDNSINRALRWEEDKLPGIPQLGFLSISDGINPPQFSSAFPYTPTPSLTGSVKLAVDNGQKAPISGLIAFVDANGNNIRDIGEAFTITDSQGLFSFYALATGQSYSIIVELPGGSNYRVFGAGADLSDPERQVTIGQGSNPEILLENLGAIYRGRVVIDSNGNGAVDATDIGADQIDLRLNITKGTESKFITTISDALGRYLFEIPAGYRSVGRPQIASSRPELGVFLPDVSIKPPVVVNPPANNPAQPKLIEEDIIASKVLTIKLDGIQPEQLKAFFDQLPGAFNKLATGDFNAVSIQMFGFKLLIDSFEFYAPNTNGLVGLKYANGWAFFGDDKDGNPNQVRFTLGDRNTGGLALKDGRLQSFQLALEGSINVAGINVEVTGLNARFDAGQLPDGSDGFFQLVGQSSASYQDYELGLALSGDGFIVDAAGIRTFNGSLTGSIPIAGQKVELGTLGMSYDRLDDSLTFTGSSKWTMSGDKTDDSYFGLDNIALKIGMGRDSSKIAGVRSLSANLAAGLKFEGIDLDVNDLSFAWLPDSDAFSISGKTTLKTDDKSVDLSAELPGDGISFSKSGVTFNAKINGTILLGDSGYTVSVTDSGATYADGKFGFQVNGSLKTSLTGNKSGDELANIGGSAYWNNGKLESISALASGKIGMENAVVEFDDITLGYDSKLGTLSLSGKAGLSLLEGDKFSQVLSLEGGISLANGEVQELTASVGTGEIGLSDNITIKLNGLNVSYNSSFGRFALSGSSELDLQGDTVGLSLPGDGIVWANGAFQSFNAGLTGSVTLQKDKAGKAVSYLESQNASFGYTNPDIFELGGSFKGVFGSSAGAQVTIGSGGIVIDKDGIRSFDAAITAVANFGETFEDKDGDFIYNQAKDGKFNDANGNGTYDFGFGIRFQDAGLVYTRSQGSGGPSIALRGLGVAAFNSEFLSGANSKGKGIAIDLATPGIVIADGKLTDFSFGITTSFDLKGLTVDQASMGARWLSSTKEMAFWGGAGITIAGKNQGLNFGNSQSPGIRLIDGVITEATASLALGFNVGDLKFELKDTGFTYHGAKNEWAIFGSASLSNIFSVSVGLGTREAPGLFIRDNDWEINNLTLALAKINLGAFSLDEANLNINRIGGSWSVYAACGVTLPIGPGVGARGEFSLVNGKVDLISVTLASATGINIPQTPLFINYISAGIRNLSNLSQITLTGSIGIGLGTSVTLFGKTATTAQFVGSFTLDPQSLRIQVDAYFGGINSGTLTQPKWKGLLAEGTGIIFLDWSHGQYYADLNLSFLSGVFIAKGHFSISDINGLVFRSTAKVQIPEEVPLLGGTSLASADFLFVYNPGRDQFFAMAWGDIPLLGTYGLKYDATPNKFSVLNGDDIKATLSRSAGSAPLSMNQLATPVLQSTSLLNASLPGNDSVGPMLFSMTYASSFAPTWEYSGQSDSIPVTEVSEGLYQARFQVRDNTQWAQQSSLKNWLQFLIDPIDGLKIETLPLEFDAETGIGTIGVRVLPPDGQYLPRGLVLRSRLQSPVELTGPGGGDPELESHWTQAYSYGGKTPPVGFDKQLNPPPEGLKVREGRFTISYRPMPDSSGRIAADWLESIRLYLDPVDGVSFKVSQPYFDAKTNKGWVVILASKDDGSFLDEGMRFTGAIRSKVALGNPEDESGLNGGEVYPLLGIRWNTDPVVVDIPTIPSQIRSGIQTTTLTGHVNDPRISEVLVSLYFSTDFAGDQEYLTRLAANGNPASDIPVKVNADGSWSTEITWEASSLPKGDLWLYGLAREGIASIPVYGESAGPFQVIRSISGTVTDIKGPYAGLQVFADLNNDEIWQSEEPRAITDNDGNYALDVPVAFSGTNLLYDIPAFLRPEDGLTRSHIVDLSNGPVNDNIRLLPTKSILRGSVFVTGDLHVDGWFDSLSQSVSGVGVVLSGPNGFMLRTSTNNRGQYELPVYQPGNYTLSLDLVQAEFLGFTLGEMDGISTTRHITIPYGPPDVFIQDPLRVDSIGLVTSAADRGNGSLASLIDLANQGFVSTINFDESLRGKTIDIAMPADSPPTPYYLWDSTQGKWTLVTPEVSEELRYGQTAFILDDDMRISGGDLGITLREAYASTNLTEGYRAFYVQPGVEFLLENITLEGFTSHEEPGNNGQTGDSTISAGGAAAGGGGAILNRGITSLNNVHLVGNSALAGNGGNSLVPAYLFQTENPGEAGVPLGTNGTPLTGGTGGGYKGGLGGQAYPVTFTYSIGDDPTILTKTVMIAGVGGGGSGLGGAIYNATGATLNITGGSSFTDNHVFAGKAGTAPEFITNLANALFGDSARTISVSGFEDAWKSFGQDGLALGGAIFNKGILNISDSTFTQNSASDAGGAIYSVGGVVSIQSTAIINNMSTTDQGVHVVPDAHNNANLDINNSLIKGKQSPFSGKPMGPAAVVVEGGQSSGSGNIISSHTGFQGKSFSSKIVPRPQSPFTGEVFVPLANGPQIDQGALAKIPYLVGNPLIEVAKPFELTFAIPSQPGQPVPSGRVILGIDATPVGQGYIDAQGKVTIRLPGMVAKKVTFDVYYEGDGLFAGNTSKKTIAIGTHNQRIVQELYQDHLGRDADAAGLRQWTERLDSGIPLEQVVRELRLSTEASQRVVQSAFNEILGRDAHTQGLNGWTRYLQSGHTANELRGELFASGEYQSTHTQDDSINSIYRTFIGRDASQAGIESWLKNWEAGMSLSQIISKIENSRESREHIVDSLYQEILNRPADGIGLREWTDSLEQGIDEDALTAALLRSPEFAG